MKRFRIVFLLALAVALAGVCQVCFAETVTLPADLTSVEDGAFFGDGSLETVILPESIRTIGSKAFAGSGVTTVNLPDSLEYIADDAFDDTIEMIGTSCFTSNAFTTLTLPGNIKTLNQAAFASCDKLETLVLSEGTEELSFYAIYDCKKLKDVYLPASVTSIGYGTFYNSADVTVHAPAGSYAAEWAAGEGIPVVTE